MERQPQILLVEDEPGIVDFLARGLRGAGFDVLCADDGLRGSELALSEPVDAVVLDLMLPGRSGLEVLADIREEKPSLPVIVLTARGEVEDRVRGLNAGAVDYLSKPFSFKELEARIRAQLRVAARTPATSIRAADIELDLLTRDVRRMGKTIPLSTTEFELLSYLLRNRGRVLTRQQILRAVWGYDHDPGTNVVDVYIGYLRRKLTVEGSRPAITTVRSVGYRIDES